MNSTTPPMNPTTTHGLGSGFGLLVRYWACNMTLVHDQGSSWPGFGYTPEEQAALRTIARGVPSLEFIVWGIFVSVFALGFIVAMALLGILLLAGTSASHSLDSVSGAAFFFNLGVVMVASLGVGFPLAMFAGSVLTGRFFKVSDQELPDAPTRIHYVHKICVQFTRFAIIFSAVVAAMCLWLPERVWLLTHSVMPVLVPAVFLAIALYYRCRPSPDQSAAGGRADTESRDSTSNDT